MTLLTHTGRPFERAPYSSAKRDQPAAANAHLAMIKHFCLIALTSLLALCAVGGIIALKTAAYLSHFTQLTRAKRRRTRRTHRRKPRLH